MNNKKVLILMSTYNGEKYLVEQLNSILNQKNVDLDILVRDDGSKDKTIEILNRYNSLENFSFYQGNNVGPAMSFIDLIKQSKKYDYYAFADQDDYWESDKIYSAISKLEESNTTRGKLYFSKVEVVDSNLKHLSYSFLPEKITLKKEMIKNYATGCTIVFDDNLKELIKRCNFSFVAMHDSLICRCALINHSFVYADNTSHIKYRQHENNVLGMKSGFFAKWKQRFTRFIHSKSLTKRTAVELLKTDLEMSEEDKEFLKTISNYNKVFKNKIKMLRTKIFDKDERLTGFFFFLKFLFNKV